MIKKKMYFLDIQLSTIQVDDLIHLIFVGYNGSDFEILFKLWKCIGSKLYNILFTLS